MNGQDVLRALGTVIDAELSAVDRDRLAALVRLIRDARACIDAFEIRVASLADELAVNGACESAASLFASEGSRSTRGADTAAAGNGVRAATRPTRSAR